MAKRADRGQEPGGRPAAAEPAHEVPPVPAERAAAEARDALASVVSRLRDELAGVRRAMRNRAVIEQAKGVLVARLGVTPDDAFDQLVRLSQQTNIKLAEVAAALVGATAPAPDEDRPAGMIDDDLREYLAKARRAPIVPAAADQHSEALRAQHHLLAARIAAASDYAQIAETIAESEVGWARPTAVLIALRDRAGALRAVGEHGADAGILYETARAAFGRTASVWRADTGSAAVPSALAAPLLAGTETVGVLAVGWSGVAELSAVARRYLVALSEPIARRIGQLSPGDVAADDPVRQVLEAMPIPAALLSPIHGAEGLITDFRFDYVNAAAATDLAEMVGDVPERTLLAMFPDTGSRQLLGEYAAVLADGVGRELSEVDSDASADGTELSVSARVWVSRIAGRLLICWQRRSESDLLYDQLLTAERIGRQGSFWWNLHTGVVRYTPELYRLLGRDPADGGLPLSDLERYVYPDDLLAVREAIRGLLLAGRTFTVEYRPVDAPGRRLRMVCEPEFDADRRVGAVRGTVQDVTREHAVEQRLQNAEEALAGQRHRLRAEAQAAEALRQAILPTDPELAATPGLAVRGLCRAPETANNPSGDWFDVLNLPTGTYLVVGDVAGSGLPAIVAAARLRTALRAYAVLGTPPGEILSRLNDFIGAVAVDRLATLVVARYEADGRTLRWSAAGQAAPVRYAPDGHAAVLTGPLGLPLGAAPGVEYGEAAVELAAGERVLLYTDGLVARRDRTLTAGLSILLHAAEHVDLADPRALVEHISAELSATPDDDLAVLSCATR